MPVESDERILVVDDNADMRRYLRRILQENWKVDTANDGMAALAKVRKSPPDLIIADLDDAGPRWPVAARRAARRPAARGYSGDGAVRARERRRVDRCAERRRRMTICSKPFAARELLARVAVQLARNRLRRAERAAREVAEQSSFMKDELVLDAVELAAQPAQRHAQHASR